MQTNYDETTITTVYQKVISDFEALNINFDANLSEIASSASKNNILKFIEKELLPQVKEIIARIQVDYNDIHKNDEDALKNAKLKRKYYLALYNNCVEETKTQFGNICITHPSIHDLFVLKNNEIRTLANAKLLEITNLNLFENSTEPKEEPATAPKLPVKECFEKPFPKIKSDQRYSKERQSAIELLVYYMPFSPSKALFASEMINHLTHLIPISNESFKSYVERCIYTIEQEKKEEVSGWKFGAPDSSTLYATIERIKLFDNSNDNSKIIYSSKNATLTYFKVKRSSVDYGNLCSNCKEDAINWLNAYIIEENKKRPIGLKKHYSEIKKRFAKKLIDALVENFQGMINKNQSFSGYLEACIDIAKVGNDGWDIGKKASTLHNLVNQIRKLDPRKENATLTPKAPQ